MMQRRGRFQTCCAVALLALATPSLGHTQSTGRLGSYERPVQFQIGIAANSPLVGSQYGDQTGTLRAADLAAIFQMPGPMRLRVDGWVIDRRPDDPHLTRTADLHTSTAFALIASGELPIQIVRDVSIGPTLGAGVVPYARGVFDRSTANPAAGTSTVIGRGVVWEAGLALRVGHVVVEQHFLQIWGADGALANGENAPLLIGLRF